MTELKPWWIFKGNREPHNDIADPKKFPAAPIWRHHQHQEVLDKTSIPMEPGNAERGKTYLSEPHICDMVNAALLLRRPLLVTGKPGTGKTALAYAVAYELQLGPVLVWPITTRSTLQDGLYRYDAIARLQTTSLNKQKGMTSKQETDIGNFLRLGPLGTALLPTPRPRVLLIDEFDKSDIDLPNDLLHIFEEGEFEIPELVRHPNTKENRPVNVRPADTNIEVPIVRGQVTCAEFPFVILTSNNERDFPPAFKRRCLPLNMEQPSDEKLAHIIEAHLGLTADDQPANLVNNFLHRSAELATDQLLNAIYLTMHNVDLEHDHLLRDAILKSLSNT